MTSTRKVFKGRSVPSRVASNVLKTPSSVARDGGLSTLVTSIVRDKSFYNVPSLMQLCSGDSKLIAIKSPSPLTTRRNFSSCRSCRAQSLFCVFTPILTTDRSICVRKTSRVVFPLDRQLFWVIPPIEALLTMGIIHTRFVHVRASARRHWCELLQSRSPVLGDVSPRVAVHMKRSAIVVGFPHYKIDNGGAPSWEDRVVD